MSTLADRIIAFIGGLSVPETVTLPEGISMMNPYRERDYVLPVCQQFYQQYYNDKQPRSLILGINPGRFGGGVTGIPFTDTQRLTQVCGIDWPGPPTYEPSSAFVYDVVAAFGGPVAFYSRFYINSVCPLGFVRQQPNGKAINYNYYDSPALQATMQAFIVDNVRAQIALGMKTDVCYCLGAGKNEKALRELNDRYHFFGSIVALPHPRYVMQYRQRYRQQHIEEYVRMLGGE
ncbi:MAG: SMUG2 DNA glycosylase family protein [Chitinophagia bacterium]|nr:SMUG2 DNA glycosylase family protein [Chitinophagia bacterium]